MRRVAISTDDSSSTDDVSSAARPLMSRRKSTFIPPGFANSFSKLEDTAAGVTFQNGYESFSAFQPPKVLRYDAHAVLAELAPWRALLSRTRHATALRFGDFLWKLGYCTAIALVVASLSGGLLHLVDKGTAEAVASLNMMVAGGLFFLLAPFVSTATARWWALRKDGIGALWGAVDDLATLSAAWFNSKSAADRGARALVLRLGLCSHALLYKQARQEEGDLDDLVTAGLLLPHEAEALRPLNSKPQVIWSWMALFWTKVLSGETATTPIPHAPQNSPLIFGLVTKARGAIGLSLAYIDTQQPFPYVHLLSLITDLALAVNAVHVGTSAGRTLAMEAHTPLNTVLMVMVQLLRVAAFTLIYQGLLGIGIALDNPCGDDPTDMPGLAFQVFMKDECEAFSAGVDAVSSDWWEGLLQPPAAAKTAATPHTTAKAKVPTFDASVGEWSIARDRGPSVAADE